MQNVWLIFLLLLLLSSCQNSLQDVELYSKDINVNIEQGTNVETCHFEKAKVQVKIIAPKLIKLGRRSIHGNARKSRNVFL